MGVSLLFADIDSFSYKPRSGIDESNGCSTLLLLLWFVFGGAGVWIQGFVLSGLGLYHLSLAPSPFCLSYFLDKVLLLSQGGLGHHPPLCASHGAGMTGVSHHTQFFVELGVLLTFCPGWPQTAILLISTYWVAGIIDMSHCIWLVFVFLTIANLTGRRWSSGEFLFAFSW
jgi:hypothetical protein